MTLSTLDPNVALIVIDLQEGIRSTATAHSMDDVIARSAELATAFRRHGRPVVLVNATGGAPGRTEAASFRSAGFVPPPGWADLVPELEQAPEDRVISKQTWGAFHDTPLHEHLQSLGVTQVVVVGVATSAGVESTARAAHEHGYHVVLAVDAMSDRDLAMHAHSVEKVFPRIGETTTTVELIERLEA